MALLFLMFLVFPIYVFSLRWLGRHGETDGSELSVKAINESQHAVRIRIHTRPPDGSDGWCWTKGIKCPPGTRFLDREILPGGKDQFLGRPCGTTSTPQEHYLYAETEDGRAAIYGPPLCQGATWRITEESLRKGVKPKPSPPLWNPKPTKKGATPTS
ncbi:hypothetical protein GCM10009678_94310 [Actinomadura kijaniata]